MSLESLLCWMKLKLLLWVYIQLLRCYLGDKLEKYVSNYSTVFAETMDRQHYIYDKTELTMATSNKNRRITLVLLLDKVVEPPYV